MKTIIFLDIDGVLAQIHKTERDDNGDLIFRKSSISALNRIIAYLDADIVISSTWRNWKTIEQFNELFKSRGIIGNVIDTTPKSEFKTPRGEEIKRWVDANNPDRFLIIDDDFVSSQQIFGYNHVLPVNSYRCLDDYDANYVCGLEIDKMKFKPFIKVK